MNAENGLIPLNSISGCILFIRGQRVMLDADLARLYGVETKALKRAVNRNMERFPEDFMFQLSAEEYRSLRSQFGTLEKGAHAKYLPYAFTEQGVAMLSGILRSPMAVQANIAIMRTFVRMRQAIETHRVLAKKLGELEAKLGAHDAQFKAVFTALRALMVQPEKKKRPIGFGVKEKANRYGKGKR